MAVVLILSGVLLTLLGVALCVVANFNLGTVLTLLLGCFILFCGIFHRKLRVFTSRGIGLVLKIIVSLFVCAEAVLVVGLALYGQIDTVDYTEDAVIVLGAGIRGDQVTQALAFRLDSAIEYYTENQNALIVVSGGKGLQETITEAEAMERYLLTRGIPQTNIVKEEQATSTQENMLFSKKILDEMFGEDYRIAVITNDFHIYRGVEYARKIGFEAVTHKGARLMWYNQIPCYLRESLAVLKLWVLS